MRAHRRILFALAAVAILALAAPAAHAGGARTSGPELDPDSPEFAEFLRNLPDAAAQDPLAGGAVTPENLLFPGLTPVQLGNFIITGTPEQFQGLLTCQEEMFCTSEMLAARPQLTSLEIFIVRYRDGLPDPIPDVYGINVNEDTRPGDNPAFSGEPTAAESAFGVSFFRGQHDLSTTTFDPATGEFVVAPAPLGFIGSVNGGLLFRPVPPVPATYQISTFVGDADADRFVEYASPPSDQPYLPAGDGTFSLANADDPADEPAGGSAPPTGPADDGGTNPLFPMLILAGGVVLGGGFVVWVRRGRAGGGGGKATKDVLSADALAVIGAEFGPTTAGPAPEVAWSTALGDEHAAQQLLLDNYGDLLRHWAADAARLRTALLDYGTGYLRTLNGSQDLQKLIRDWQVNRSASQYADIALTVATLVVGLGRLGIGGVRWLTGARAAASNAPEIAAAVQKAKATIAASESLTRVAGELAQHGHELDELAQIVMMGDEAGYTVEQIIAHIDDWAELMRSQNRLLGEGLPALFVRFVKPLMNARGFAEAPAEVSILIHTLTGSRNAIVNGIGASPEIRAAILKLREMAQSRPDFFTWLGKLYETFKFGADNPLAPHIDTVAQLVGPDDFAFLKAIVEAAAAGTDDMGRFAGRLRDLLGPAKVAAMEAAPAVEAVTGAAGGATRTTVGATVAAGAVASEEGRPPPIVGAVGSVDAFAAQFGLSGSLGADTWTWICSPIETTAGLWHGLEGMSLYQDLLTNHGNDLVQLGPAVADAIGALESMGQHIRNLGLDDPSRPLGGAGEKALRDALDDLQDAFDRAGPAWQDAHRSDLDAKRAHILQKLAAIGGAVTGFKAAAAALPALIAELRSMQVGPDGKLLGATEHLNPDLALALSKLMVFLEGINHLAFAGATRVPVPKPYDPGPEPPKDSDEWLDWYASTQLGQDFKAPPVQPSPFADDAPNIERDMRGE